jgi:2-polyprenyl-3-methyl-5-hydroxy-6-metoxy-1,4-benzoquinol methylase
VKTTIRHDTTARHVRKYESQNPVQRWLLERFHRKVRAWIDEVRPRRVLDFGCGEAYFWEAMGRLGPLPDVVGIDLREDALDAARARMPGLTFVRQDLFAFDPGEEGFDLVVAIETLEHLYEPGRVLARLCQLSRGHLLLTVPHEPFFQLSNLLRGRDLSRLGNHPEHVQRWTRRGFERFVSPLVRAERVETTFPFTLVLGRPREAASKS